eukprot:gene22746-23998_t
MTLKWADGVDLTRPAMKSSRPPLGRAESITRLAPLRLSRAGIVMMSKMQAAAPMGKPCRRTRQNENLPAGVIKGSIDCCGACLTLLPVTVHANDRTVVVGTDNRLDGEALALRLKGLIADPDKIFAATGSVECGGVRATGQLTRSGNRVTSAAHTFFDESGRSRALSGVCQFSILINGQLRTYPITPLTPTISGSTAPYAASGQHDWAVARLE